MCVCVCLAPAATHSTGGPSPAAARLTKQNDDPRGCFGVCFDAHARYLLDKQISPEAHVAAVAEGTPKGVKLTYV